MIHGLDWLYRLSAVVSFIFALHNSLAAVKIQLDSSYSGKEKMTLIAISWLAAIMCWYGFFSWLEGVIKG